nr:MAG TPA: hypothetical protein [Caudoviricetes sp.]
MVSMTLSILITSLISVLKVLHDSISFQFIYENICCFFVFFQVLYLIF